jgi:GxxExxY protein
LQGLGPGLLESVYELVLAYELEKRGVRALRQQAVPIVYQGIRIDMGFRADLIVEDSVIVEIILLINFNVLPIKDGITRIANGMPD